MVRSAVYEALAGDKEENNSRETPLLHHLKKSDVGGVLRFSLAPGDNYPRLPHEVIIRGDIESILAVRLNGEAYSDYSAGSDQVDTAGMKRKRTE